jgi:hypothetical protein
MQKILEVTKVNVVSTRSLPPILKITATGTVPTAGWANPQLVPYTYIQAPPDGIYDFDFVADPPEDIVAQVVTPIQANYQWRNSPAGLKGIRIHASTNSVVFRFEPVESDCESQKQSIAT